MSLAVNPLNRNANATGSPRIYKKRNVSLVGTALLLEVYNFWQTRELSSCVGQNEQSPKYVTATANINSNLGSLKEVLLKVLGEIYFPLFENRLLNIK